MEPLTKGVLLGAGGVLLAGVLLGACCRGGPEPLYAAHLYVYRVVGGQRAHCYQDIGIQKDAPFGEQL